jgi:hypothetical protein
MAEAHAQFKRAVLGLEHHTGRYGLPLAVEVARLLDLDLLGMFVEEDNLLRMAGLPFVREFSALHGWRTVDSEQIARELSEAAASTRRMFADAVKPLHTASAFDVFRGSMAQAITAHARPDDIVILCAPAAAGEYSAEQFPRLIATALEAAAGVLLIPRRIIRVAGDVVAVARSPDDRSTRLAAEIARAAREELVVIELYGERERGADARTIDRGATRRSADALATSDPALLVAAFRGERERLVVMTDGSIDRSLPTILASWRRVPVLVIAPERSQDGSGGEPEARE